MIPKVLVWREPWSDPDVPLPRYETAGAAGADLRACFPPDVIEVGRRGLTLDPGAATVIPTGLRVELPPGFEMQIRARSGLALKHGIGLPNAPGTIDADYRGPLGVILINWGDAPFFVEHGARIAQVVVAPVAQAAFVLTEELSDTTRGGGGFGSTGTT